LLPLPLPLLLLLLLLLLHAASEVRSVLQLFYEARTAGTSRGFHNCQILVPFMA